MFSQHSVLFGRNINLFRLIKNTVLFVGARITAESMLFVRTRTTAGLDEPGQKVLDFLANGFVVLSQIREGTG